MQFSWWWYVGCWTMTMHPPINSKGCLEMWESGLCQYFHRNMWRPDTDTRAQRSIGVYFRVGRIEHSIYRMICKQATNEYTQRWPDGLWLLLVVWYQVETGTLFDTVCSWNVSSNRKGGYAVCN
jgi:hypothetical protein